MKLINKTILNYLFIGVPLLLFAGVISYFIIKNELREGIDENLEREKLNAQKLVEALKEPANTYLSYDSLSSVKVIHTSLPPNNAYSDTSIFNKQENEWLNYRVLKSTYRFNNSNYLLTLSHTTLEEEELMDSLFPAFALIIISLVLSFFCVSWLLSKKLWQPFYNTLSVLGSYDIKNHAATHFSKEKTTEFNQLNGALNKMTEKIHTDFIRQKEFAENASHEMQTPLAIVRANLSLLMQSSNLQETEMGQLEAIENTIRKLTALNKTLILLTRIGNNQYPETIAVSLEEKIESALEAHTDFVQAKNIQVVSRFNAKPVIRMNAALADILINNLLQNAIRHNTNGGEIKIVLHANSFSISNSGEPLSIPEEELFTRFKKNDSSKDSLGLGLSLVKSIADLYAMTIHYRYSNHTHHFILNF